MAAILTAYLRAKASSDFKWGSEDCSTFVVEWLDLATGVKALPHWLGKFDSSSSCRRFVRKAGGFEAIATLFFAEHYGIGKTDIASGGNVVLSRCEYGESMGIRVDAKGMVAHRSNRGLYVAQTEIVSEWGPPCRR